VLSPTVGHLYKEQAEKQSGLSTRRPSFRRIRGVGPTSLIKEEIPTATLVSARRHTSNVYKQWFESTIRHEKQPTLRVLTRIAQRVLIRLAPSQNANGVPVYSELCRGR
jgi:hypothetical protein